MYQLAQNWVSDYVVFHFTIKNPPRLDNLAQMGSIFLHAIDVNSPEDQNVLKIKRKKVWHPFRWMFRRVSFHIDGWKD